MSKKRKLVVANWKMHPTNAEEAKSIFSKIRRAAKKMKQTDVVVAPSFIHIPVLSKLLPSKNIFLGAQNIHQKDFGAYTGEVSINQLKEFKIRYIILGHSERRALGEGDEIIKEKVESALRHGITPIVCVGEKERDTEGEYLNFIKEQLLNIFGGVQKKYLSDCVIVYEPVWAIGHSYNNSLSSTDMHVMSLFIRKTLSEIFGKDYGWNVKILYGGSVEDENAKDLMKKGDIAGFLVGHASLDPLEFSKILKIVDLSR